MTDKQQKLFEDKLRKMRARLDEILTMMQE